MGGHLLAAPEGLEEGLQLDRIAVAQRRLTTVFASQMMIALLACAAAAVAASGDQSVQIPAAPRRLLARRI